jgi:hypothetical protein
MTECMEKKLQLSALNALDANTNDIFETAQLYKIELSFKIVCQTHPILVTQLHKNDKVGFNFTVFLSSKKGDLQIGNLNFPL